MWTVSDAGYGISLLSKGREYVKRKKKKKGKKGKKKYEDEDDEGEERKKNMESKRRFDRGANFRELGPAPYPLNTSL